MTCGLLVYKSLTFREKCWCRLLESNQRPAVYKFQIALPQTTEPHKKPQLRQPSVWGQMGLVCPVLVAAR